MPKVSPGNIFTQLKLSNIHRAPLSVPSQERKWMHLHFARFAACPICNIHVQTLVAASRKIAAANIQQVVFFHSSNAALLPYQGNFPFDVVGDPQKEIYKKLDVEASPRALLDPRTWPTMVRASLGANKPPKSAPGNGVFGLPADILIAPDGRVKAVHYGKYATDVWSVEALLQLVQR